MSRALGKVNVAGVGDVVTLEQFQGWCERDEATIRNQYPGRELPAHAEATLRMLDAGTLLGAMRRWGYLKHLFHSRVEGLEKASGGSESPADIARQLLRREPVRVELPGRTVLVTGRSYAAMAEIAAHASRLAEIDRDLRRIGELEAATLEEVTAPGSPLRRHHFRRRFRKLGEIHRRLLVESTLHRQAIYAHALTPDGAPAESLADAPAWWVELGPADDALLIAAVWEAGVGRYARLGEPPESDGEGSTQRAEDWGWASCFAGWERHLRVGPAALYDRDLGQLTAWMRGTATAPAEDELDG